LSAILGDPTVNAASMVNNETGNVDVLAQFLARNPQYDLNELKGVTPEQFSKAKGMAEQYAKQGEDGTINVIFQTEDGQPLGQVMGETGVQKVFRMSINAAAGVYR